MSQSMSRGAHVQAVTGGSASARPQPAPAIGVYEVQPAPRAGVVPAGGVVRCTNLFEFKIAFGGFTDTHDDGTNPRHGELVLAVQDFFSQGGSCCYVTRVDSAKAMDRVLARLEAFGATEPDYQQAAMSVIRNIGGRMRLLWSSGAEPEATGDSEPDYQQAAMSVIRNIGGRMGTLWGSGAELAVLVRNQGELVIFRIGSRMRLAR